MSKKSPIKDISQSSIFSFFRPVSQSDSSKEKDAVQKTYEKRSHKEIVDNEEESKKKEKEMAPNNKTFPPKAKNGKNAETIVKDMENNIDCLLNDIQDAKKSKKKLMKGKKNSKIITDSDENDSDFKVEDENGRSNEEKSTPVKTNKNKKNSKEVIEEESMDDNVSSNGIDLNNFLKETLDKEMEQNPNSLDANVRKTFQGTINKLSQNKNENKTPSNKKMIKIIVEVGVEAEVEVMQRKRTKEIKIKRIQKK
jgi:hypothetical protein